jgi:hypothetical protein
MAVRNPERYFDNRTVKRHLRRGHVSQADYQAFLDALPDVTDKIRPRDDGGDDDDDDDYDDDDYDDDDDDDEDDAPSPASPAPARPSEPGGASRFDDDSDDD